MIPGAACPMMLGGGESGTPVVAVAMVADTPDGGTLIDSLTVRTSQTSYRGGYADVGRRPDDGGKWQFEVELIDNHGSTAGGQSVGVASTVPTLGSFGPASANNDCVTWGPNHGTIGDSTMTSGSAGSAPATWSVGGILGVVVDFDSNTIRYYLNGVAFTSPTLAIIGDGAKYWRPLCGDNYGTGNYSLRFNFTAMDYPVSGATPWAGGSPA